MKKPEKTAVGLKTQSTDRAPGRWIKTARTVGSNSCHGSHAFCPGLSHQPGQKGFTAEPTCPPFVPVRGSNRDKKKDLKRKQEKRLEKEKSTDNLKIF